MNNDIDNERQLPYLVIQLLKLFVVSVFATGLHAASIIIHLINNNIGVIPFSLSLLVCAVWYIIEETFIAKH